MIIALARESAPGERRVALVPQSVAKLRGLGHELWVESGAGLAAGYPNEAYTSAGAQLCRSRAELFSNGQVIAQVRGTGANPASVEDLELARRDQIWIGLHEPLWRPQPVRALAERGPTVLALELLPRITRAQNMDVLSSMATLAGYKAVVLAASHLPKMFQMLMTAAGTTAAARVLVLGAGVAGLQAIATARRLGALVEGYDVRPAAREQILSLGARVLELELATEGAEDAGGYARAQGEEFQRRQRELMAEVLPDKDVVITTAAIPGERSPVLLTQDMVERMRLGAVIVDLGAERGGNCELTRPDEVTMHRGVTILGPTDLPSSVAYHASQMYSNNLTTLLKHLTREGEIVVDMGDEITRGLCVGRGGEVIHPRVLERLDLAEIGEVQRGGPRAPESSG